MKKIYIAPEMEILDTEIEGGILTGSWKEENGYGGTEENPALGRQSGFGFDDFDDFEEDDY